MVCGEGRREGEREGTGETPATPWEREGFPGVEGAREEGHCGRAGGRAGCGGGGGVPRNRGESVGDGIGHRWLWCDVCILYSREQRIENRISTGPDPPIYKVSSDSV